MHPILFKIGTFEVHSFGVMMVLAFIAAIAVAQWRSAKYGLNRNQVGDVAFWALIAGVIGARVAFIAQELPYYTSHPSELLSIQFRGLTSFGGLIFGVIAVLVWARVHKVGVWKLLDLVAPAFVIGHAIGRIGCLLNGCCFGGACPSYLPWGIHVEGSSVLHHPAQAYDTLMNLAVFGILIWRERRGLAWGQLAGLALTLHGITRIVYEFWRGGTDAQVDAGEASSTYWGNLPFTHIEVTQAQAMAAVLVVAGIAIYYVCGRQRSPSSPSIETKAEALTA
jgi:phosphatidylglycerol:prolipoprotein diacylglycerol transferase